MSKRTLASLTIALCATAGHLDAQNLYFSEYWNGPGAPIFNTFVGQTTPQLTANFSAMEASGMRCVDIESYRDTDGIVKHDAYYEPGSHNTTLYVDIPAGLVPALGGQFNKQRITDLSSWEDKAGGERRYSMVLRSNGNPGLTQNVALGITVEDYDQSMENPNPNLWPEVYETWFDASTLR